MLRLMISFPKQELVSLPIPKKSANPVIPELALAKVALLTTPTRVELSGEGFPNRICKISFPIKSSDLLVLSNREGHLIQK